MSFNLAKASDSVMANRGTKLRSLTSNVVGKTDNTLSESRDQRSISSEFVCLVHRANSPATVHASRVSEFYSSPPPDSKKKED